MSYGAPVQAAMVVDIQPMSSQYRPELAEVIEMDPTSANSVRLQSMLTKRMPQMQNINLFSNARAREAEELALGMRKSFATTKMQNRRSSKIAKAKNRAQERINLRNTKFRKS